MAGIDGACLIQTSWWASCALLCLACGQLSHTHPCGLPAAWPGEKAEASSSPSSPALLRTPPASKGEPHPNPTTLPMAAPCLLLLFLWAGGALPLHSLCTSCSRGPSPCPSTYTHTCVPCSLALPLPATRSPLHSPHPPRNILTGFIQHLLHGMVRPMGRGHRPLGSANTCGREEGARERSENP